MPITKEMFTEKFDDVDYTLTRRVRESNDTGWFPAEDLADDNQLTKPPDSEKREYTNDDDSYIDSDGLIFMYEYPSVKMSVVIKLDVELEKFIVQGINSLWITAQKGLRTKGTKWCQENVEGVTFLASDLSKGRSTLSVSDKVLKSTKDASMTEYDEAIAALRQKREDKFGKVK